MLTVSNLKPSDIPDPESWDAGEVAVYRKRRGMLEEFPISAGRERSTGRIYYCLRLADGFRTYPSLSALKTALRR